jgi:hypothetical protein
LVPGAKAQPVRTVKPDCGRMEMETLMKSALGIL